MSNDLKSRIDSRLYRIVNILLLNASFIDNLGLLNGKMGIAIFFFHYARYTDNEIYERYAGELIDEICEEMNCDTPVDFADGLTGIGWGIEYLAQNSFLDADTDEVLAEIDSAIIRNRLTKPLFLENSNDLFGYGLYYLARLRSSTNSDDLNTLMKKETLILLADECERILIHKRFLDFNIPLLSVSTLNSIAYFLVEMFRLQLIPIKIEKLISYYPSYIKTNISNYNNITDLIYLKKFLEELTALVKNSKTQSKYQSSLELIDLQIKNPIEENVLINTSRQVWNQLIYDPKESNNWKKIHKVFFEMSEDDWNKQFSSINKDNLSLNSGLAGVGMALLQSFCSYQELEKLLEVMPNYNS